MKKYLYVPFVFLVLGCFFLIKKQSEKFYILKNGKEVIIEGGNFSVPFNCDYKDKAIKNFLKFEYNGKSHSLRIKSKDCKQIQKRKNLLLYSNLEETIFIYDKPSLIMEFISSIIVMLIFVFCGVKLYLKPLE